MEQGQEVITQKIELPLRIEGTWLRGVEPPPFVARSYLALALCFFIAGARGSGKSCLNENLATHHCNAELPVKDTGKIVDLFGARDNEGLAWCRSPYAESILLLIGDSVDLKCQWNTKHIQDLRLSDFNDYHVVICASAFFANKEEENHSLATIMDTLWKRSHWVNPWYLLVREGANLIHSRLSLGESQIIAKNYMIYVMREMRHCGFAVGLDAIRQYAVDKDLRTLADYTFLKAADLHGYEDTPWVYASYNPVSCQRMRDENFIVLSQRGSYGDGYFEYPPWHKTEKEDMLAAFDLRPEHGEPIDYGEKGWKPVNDYEHASIIRERIEQELSYDKIAKIHRGRSSSTIHEHVERHNNYIKSMGYCPRCRRTRNVKLAVRRG